MAKYKFAVVSTDTGHNGTDSDGTFVINNPETQNDFGYRAVHLSTVLSKVVVQNFYGEAAKKSYWIGRSKISFRKNVDMLMDSIQAVQL